MPELTVSMPVYNCEAHISDSVLSVLNQQDVDFEFILVDDCSNDNTVNIISSINDRRLLLIRNNKRIGKNNCYNLVIEKSNSPFLTIIDYNCILFDKATLKKILNRIKESETIGQLHIYDIRADYNGNLTRKDVENRWNNLPIMLNPFTDFKRDLLLKGNILNNPTTYRKSVFEDVGLFNEKLNRKAMAEYEMSLKILDKYEIALLPEFLCCIKSKRSFVKRAGISDDFNLLIQRTNIALHLFKSHSANYFGSFQYNIYKLFMLGFLNILIKRAKVIKEKYKKINVSKFLNKEISN